MVKSRQEQQNNTKKPVFLQNRKLLQTAVSFYTKGYTITFLTVNLEFGTIWKKANMKTIFELMLIIFDFVSDLLVGIGLYQACHKVFAGLSLTFLALPSILILLFLIISCNYPFKTEDRMTKYIKEKSGLYPVGLMGK